ncbi:hypothetical protein [Planococcus halotolerans]|uniref:Uncharacterized protein n=1 Tax=Planococcus halotolerans TaxID=2233542 RepID=A0A365KX20_9BACL|nr:hypothetical protein [Planococcus halotolerans]QHJ69140.1 hypothetical protein DNR44_000115 [Planococcus halotolerans]RAZ77659.1 hypothetical protein DP120_09250 [Planococcus halotolerans]
MKFKSLHLGGLLFIALTLSACGSGSATVEETIYEDEPVDQSAAVQYEDDKMIGTSGPPDKENKILEVGISEWEKRHDGPTTTGQGISYHASYDDKTAVRNEDGTEASLDDIKFGQKVQINPPRGDSFEGYAEEIIILDMTYEEKYEQLLAHNDGIRIVIMYEYGERLPEEMKDAEPLFEEANNILENTGKQVGASWHEYDKDFVADFKEELEIEQFPAVLVFDRKGMLFKSNDVEEMFDFLRGMKE